MMETVTVIPEERIVSFGTSTSLIRTGIRCARRTHSKVAFTFCNRLVPVGFCVSPIPRAMLSTRPLIGAARTRYSLWRPSLPRSAARPNWKRNHGFALGRRPVGCGVEDAAPKRGHALGGIAPVLQGFGTA